MKTAKITISVLVFSILPAFGQGKQSVPATPFQFTINGKLESYTEDWVIIVQKSGKKIKLPRSVVPKESLQPEKEIHVRVTPEMLSDPALARKKAEKN